MDILAQNIDPIDMLITKLLPKDRTGKGKHKISQTQRQCCWGKICKQLNRLSGSLENWTAIEALQVD